MVLQVEKDLVAAHVLEVDEVVNRNWLLLVESSAHSNFDSHVWELALGT